MLQPTNILQLPDTQGYTVYKYGYIVVHGVDFEGFSKPDNVYLSHKSLIEHNPVFDTNEFREWVDMDRSHSYSVETTNPKSLDECDATYVFKVRIVL